ncbi:hypothetical protein [Algicola sagamiensis]|uniref:hypothetical protein n=1 Tax=Algicola sagamiensis TaxID=163869 RepID=UPI0003800E55|nr:hypothetical protein [Algicola sagamiensis]
MEHTYFTRTFVLLFGVLFSLAPATSSANELETAIMLQMKQAFESTAAESLQEVREHITQQLIRFEPEQMVSSKNLDLASTVPLQEQETSE